MREAMIIDTPATSGKCHFVPGPGDFDEVGEFDAEVEISYTDLKVLTIDGIKVVVKAKLPK